jgi:hypothetical protein
MGNGSSVHEYAAISKRGGVGVPGAQGSMSPGRFHGDPALQAASALGAFIGHEGVPEP